MFKEELKKNNEKVENGIEMVFNVIIDCCLVNNLE